MTREELKKSLDDLDDGQEDGEPIARPIPRLTAGDVRYLKTLIEADQALKLT
jgi:hypothetical protein